MGRREEMSRDGLTDLDAGMIRGSASNLPLSLPSPISVQPAVLQAVNRTVNGMELLTSSSIKQISSILFM